MSDPLEEFQRLKSRIAEKQREADKAQGALDEIMKQLKEDFGCDSLEEAREMLNRLEAKEQALAAKFIKRLRAYKKKFGKVLELV